MGFYWMKKQFLLCNIILLNASVFAANLQDVIQTVLSSNPHMQQKISEYRSTLYDLDKAKAEYKPSVDLSGGIGPEHTERRASNPTIKSDLTRQEASLIVTENLFQGFHTIHNVEEQKSRIQSTQFYTLQEANALSLKTVQTYLNVIKNKEILDLEYENLQTHTRINNMMREKMAAGYGKRADLEQSEARMVQASANYIAQLNNYQDAILNFERFYGEIPSSFAKPERPEVPGRSLEELLNIAFKYNPTILTENADISVQKARHARDKSSFFPKIDAEFSANRQNNIDGYENKDDSYRGMLKLSYNLYQGGFDEATRLQNLQNIASQELSLTERQRAVTEKLKLAWISYQYNSNRIRCLKLHRDLSRKTADSYAEEYQLGRRTLLDLLNIELEYTSARKEVETAENELILASYRILDGIGLTTYVLQPGMYSTIGLKQPDDLKFSVLDNNPPLTQYGDFHRDINIAEMCNQPYIPIQPVLVSIPEIDALSKETPPSTNNATVIPSKPVSNTKGIIIDETDPDNPSITYTDITFAYNSAVLSEESRKNILMISEKLVKDPNVYIEIHGHTDNKGSDHYNMKLSTARAQAAKDVMTGSGIDEKRINIYGHSFHKPIADNSTDEGRQANRRIEFIIKKDTNAKK